MNRPLPTSYSPGLPVPPAARPAMKAVPQLDLDRFLGRWHEVARLPSASQRLTDRHITVELARGAGGGLTLRRLARQPDGTDRGTKLHLRRRWPIEEPGQFQLSAAPGWLQWLPSAWQPWWALALDRDYQWAMLGDPRRRGLWILGRDAAMERSVLETLKGKARALGYDLAPLIVSGELRSYLPV